MKRPRTGSLIEWHANGRMSEIVIFCAPTTYGNTLVMTCGKHDILIEVHEDELIELSDRVLSA